MRDAEKAIELDPKFLKPYFHLQRALKKLKQFQEAKEIIRQAREIAPNNEDFRVAWNEVTRLLRHTIEDYELHFAIGHGNFTSIVKAELIKEPGKFYAMKIGDKDRVSHLKKGHELKREEAILRRCNHPNIVKLVEAFRDDQSIYLVLEHCESDMFEQAKKLGLGENLSRYYLVQVRIRLSKLRTE